MSGRFVRIFEDWRDTWEAQVFSPFEAKDIIRGMPTRRWDKERRCWVIPVDDAAALRGRLEWEGFTVQVHSNWRPEPRTTTVVNWADSLFQALPEALAEKAFKALTRVLHPDTGGDTALMQQLNGARDRATGKRGRP